MTPRPRRSARTVTLVAALALAVVGVGTAGSLPSTALLTDTESTTSAAVSSGSVALAPSAGSSAGTWLGSVTLAPGESAYQGLLVTNTGSLRLRYAVTSTSTAALAEVLQVDIRALSPALACTAITHAAGSSTGPAPVPLGGAAGFDLVGDPAAGAQTGDRELAAGAAERLCLEVVFPTGTGLGRSAAGTSATATIVIRAENA